MSGPKVSIYEIVARKRRNLLEQLDCFQQSFVCDEEIRESVMRLNEMGEHMQSMLAALEFVNRRNGDCASEISVLANNLDVLPQVCQSFLEELAEAPVLQVDKFTLTEAELEKRKNTLERLRALQNKVAAKHEEIETALAPVTEKAKQAAANVENAIADDVASVRSFPVMPSDTEDERLELGKKKVEEQLQALALDANCPGELISEVLSASATAARISSLEQLQTFRAVTVRPLQNRIEAVIKKKRDEKGEYAELRTRLAALSSFAAMEPKELPPDDGNLERLRIIVAGLEKRLVAQAEQAYISDCVNEVMSEMGYDVIGNRSVVKKSGKRFRNELFSYSDGTAINVTYDSDGQIAMELGGIGRADRIPTAEEADVLEEDMESFCSDFKNFEKRLMEKGVAVESRVSMAPSLSEYATIINIDDYTITATTLVQEIAVAGKRSKATAKRAMQKGDS